jgi:hypothetical protein
MVLSIRYVHMAHEHIPIKQAGLCSAVKVMSSMAQPCTPEQWIQRSQFIPHTASSVVVQFLKEDTKYFLGDVSIKQKHKDHLRDTLNLPSTFNTISPYEDVQFGGGLPMDPTVLLALAIPHRLDSVSSGVCTYGSAPVNR